MEESADSHWETSFHPIEDSESPDPPPPQPVSRNVVVCLVMVAMMGLAESIWMNTVLVAYLYLLAGGKDGASSNTKVGIVEAAQGMSQLLTAIPVGWAADKHGRAPVLMMGGVVNAVACGGVTFALYTHLDFDESYFIWIGAMCLYGVAYGVILGPAQALFADSVPKGTRSYWYNLLYACYFLPSTIGPLLAIVLFQVYGDHWTLGELKPVMVLGLTLEIPVVMMLFMMHDEHSIHEKPDSEPEEDDEIKQGTTPAQREVNVCGVRFTIKSLPYVLFVCDLFGAIGSGMTIKYFPLFFKDDLGLSPSPVQAIFAITPVFIVMFSGLALKVAALIGRVQTIISVRLIGCLLLLGMSILYDGGNRSWEIFVPIYIIRSACMNCTYPLDESVLMDNVPKEERARWKSLESVGTAGWCGSAFLGGLLADHYDYATTFAITAVISSIGELLKLVLVPLVPIKEAGEDEKLKVLHLGEKLEKCWEEHQAIYHKSE